MAIPRFLRWLPVSDVPDRLFGVAVYQPPVDDLLIACDGQFKNGQCLVLHFVGFKTYQVQDDCEHSWPMMPSLKDPPKSTDSNFTFPFLEIENSPWAWEFSVKYGQNPASHFTIVSHSFIVDLVATAPPRIGWLAPEKVDAFGVSLLAYDRA